MTPGLTQAFDRFPDDVRVRLSAVRGLIFDVGRATEGVGEIVETLKWGQPSYATVRPKSGTPIRLGLSKDGRPALLVHCQTRLIAGFRDQFEDRFAFEGNRALVLGADPDDEREALAACIRQALTYHLR